MIEKWYLLSGVKRTAHYGDAIQQRKAEVKVRVSCGPEAPPGLRSIMGAGFITSDLHVRRDVYGAHKTVSTGDLMLVCQYTNGVVTCQARG